MGLAGVGPCFWQASSTWEERLGSRRGTAVEIPVSCPLSCTHQRQQCWPQQMRSQSSWIEDGGDKWDLAVRKMQEGRGSPSPRQPTTPATKYVGCLAGV